MSFSRILVTASAALALWVSPAFAQYKPPQPTLIATLSGTCKKFTLSKDDLSSVCVGRLTNEEYRDNRVAFTFYLRKGSRLVFSGPGLKQQHLNADTVRQPIDRISLLVGPDQLGPPGPANGECRYTNPYKGVSEVRCVARDTDGGAEAAFVSDGGVPAIQKFGQR